MEESILFVWKLRNIRVHVVDDYKNMIFIVHIVSDYVESFRDVDHYVMSQIIQLYFSTFSYSNVFVLNKYCM